MDFLHGIEVLEIDTGLRTVQTVRSSIIGIVGTAPLADNTRFPLNQPAYIFGPEDAAALGTTGTLADAYEAIFAQGVNLAIVVRVEEGLDADATRANVLGDSTAMTGLWAFLQAENVLKNSPRILVAPGFTGDRPGGAANPVVTDLISVCARLRAVGIVDGPNTTTADALTWRGDFDTDRIYPVDPGVRVYDPAALSQPTGTLAGGQLQADQTAALVTRPASAYAAGIMSRKDNDRGFWFSPSNTVLQGVVGAARPIGFRLSDPQAESNILNEQGIATIIHDNGFKLWGNRSLSTDPQWAFISVRRTADLIYDSIERAHIWALDRPISPQLVIDIRDSVQLYLNDLKALGAILGGQVTFDPELNSQAQLAAGKVTLDFDIEPPAPLERLTFRAHRNGAYYETLALDVAAAA